MTFIVVDHLDKALFFFLGFVSNETFESFFFLYNRRPNEMQEIFFRIQNLNSRIVFYIKQVKRDQCYNMCVHAVQCENINIRESYYKGVFNVEPKLCKALISNMITCMFLTSFSCLCDSYDSKCVAVL